MTKKEMIALRAKTYRDQTPKQRCGNCGRLGFPYDGKYCGAIGGRTVHITSDGLCDLWQPEKKK